MTISRSAVRSHNALVPVAVDELRGLLLRRDAIDVRSAESDKSENSHEALLLAILPLLEEAHGILREVAARFEEAHDDSAAMTIADIATLAAMALQERRSFLTHPQPCDHWTFIESCEHSLRSLGKSASVVESALARYGGLASRIDRAADLDASLRVRRRYAALRREIDVVALQSIDVQSRLQSASRSISALLNGDEYRAMRLGDRRELRMLQFRIQSWLSNAYPSPAAGERTWEEVMAVISLLAGVNQRSELVMHDAGVLRLVADALASGDDPRAWHDAAAPLFGLDPELDELLDVQSARAGDRKQWEAVIDRICAQRGICGAEEQHAEWAAEFVTSEA